MNIEQKTIAITGAARGLGRAMALEFARRGGQLALLDVDQSALDGTREQCRLLGAKTVNYVCNVSDEASVIAALDAVVSDFGHLDVMINNAGVLKDALLIKVKDGVIVDKMSLAQWNTVIQVNLTGVFLCAREAAERMIKSGRGGVIINLASLSKEGNVGQSNYSASKAGVAAMTVTWAKELARFNIRVGSIAPGFIATDILSSMPADVLARVTQPIPLRRLGTPEEVAKTAVFIVENDYFTGRTIDLDGGMRL
jgi:3-oxoacyl-[acyl-carrier protein] reductase